MKLYIVKKTRIEIATGPDVGGSYGPLNDPAIGMMLAAIINGFTPVLPPAVATYGQISALGFPNAGTGPVPVGGFAGLSLLGAGGQQNFKVSNAVITTGGALRWGSTGQFAILGAAYPNLRAKGSFQGLSPSGAIVFPGINNSSVFPNQDVKLVDNSYTNEQLYNMKFVDLIKSTSILEPEAESVQAVIGAARVHKTDTDTYMTAPAGSGIFKWPPIQNFADPVEQICMGFGLLHELYVVEVDDAADQAANQAGTPLYWVTNTGNEAAFMMDTSGALYPGAMQYGISGNAVKTAMFVKNGATATASALSIGNSLSSVVGGAPVLTFNTITDLSISPTKNVFNFF